MFNWKRLTGRHLICVGLLLSLLGGFASGAMAQGCNVVNVQTVIPPDNFGHSVYITLSSELNGVTTTCDASFAYPASGETDTVQEKCAALVAAVSAQCDGAQFGTIDSCTPDAKFVVFDTSFLATLTLGISNDPNIFSQTGDGQAIPDYEGDVIVNSCGGEEFGSNGTFGGTATGVKIREENPNSGVIVRLDVFTVDEVGLPPDPPTLVRSFMSDVASSPGDSAESLVADVVADLQSQIANEPKFAQLITVSIENERTMAMRTTSSALGLSSVTMTNDMGITSGSLGGSSEALAQLSAPTETDTDGDGVLDDADNCTLGANADQRDTNGDGFGNVCDADLDGNCYVNVTDLGLLRSVFFSADADADFNGDGVVNVADLGAMRAQFFREPGPSAQAGCDVN